MIYRVTLSKEALKDLSKLKRAGLLEKAMKLLNLLESDPFTTVPRYEKLVGDLSGLYSRRINHQHRLVYSVGEDGLVSVYRMWTHYD